MRAYLGAIRLIRSSRYTLILDGHAGPSVRQLLDDVGNHDAQVWVRQPREPKHTWVSHPRRATLDLDLLRAVAEGEQVGIACGSAAHALALGALMACVGVRVGVISPRVRETITGKGVDADIDRVGIYNPDGSFDATTSASYDLADLSWANTLDVLLITWAAGTGVDIPGEWDRGIHAGNGRGQPVPVG